MTLRDSKTGKRFEKWQQKTDKNIVVLTEDIASSIDLAIKEKNFDIFVEKMTKIDFRKKDEIQAVQVFDVIIKFHPIGNELKEWWDGYILMMTNRKLKEIASFYENKEMAYKLLKKSIVCPPLDSTARLLIDSWIILCSSGIKDIDKFLKIQKEAFEKRQKNNIKHSIGILENELDNTSSFPLFGGISERSAAVTNIQYEGTYMS